MAAPMFEKVGTVLADGNIPVAKYRSKKTGLSVCIAQVEGPLVNGYFCLATEAHDDDGLPHTLEHLVFMGSEDFPYKGVLDLLANRCLASGTNAWTDTDHTCYTMTNAGDQGFLNLMPIYLDHILYPTLTDSGYTTEVHHINGNGEDAGVVYCEMQGRENSGESITHLELIRALYPGHCGYKSETGGIMKSLRESTSHKKVCSYHKEFYRPENLCLIITGQIKPEEVFKGLQPLEDKIISKGSLPKFTRPWQSPVPALPGSVEKLVKYAADDETHGIVIAAWRGPPAKDQYSFNSVGLLLDYLTDSAISPLQRDFVEIDEPFCSDVHGNLIENAESSIYIKFDNVFKNKLDSVFPRLQDVLKKISNGLEKIDMTRISNLIQRKVLDALASMEDNPHNKMASFLIGDFLFSDNQSDLECRVQTVKLYTKMKAEPESYWIGLINKYMTDKHHVLIIGEPSIAEQERLAKEENERVEKQRERLGKDGLQEKATILEKATEENEKEAPDSVVTSVDVPNVDSIHFHPIVASCNRKVEQSAKDSGYGKNPAFPLDDIPFRFQLDDVHTNFVQMHVMLDSTCLPQELKYFLPLYCEILFESPILRDGVLVSHEEIISQLEADTLSTESCIGVNGGKFSCGSFPQIVMLKIQVEKAKYELGVKWLREILYQTKFPAERLKVIAKRMNNDISKYKRKGNAVLKAVFRSLVFSQDCNHQVNSMLKQHKFLENLLKTLESDPKKVEEKMEEVRRLLTNPSNLTVHLSVDVEKLSADGYKPAGVWSTLVPEDKQVTENSCVMKKTYEYVVPLSECKHKSVVVGVGSIESSFLIQAVDCVKSPVDEDLAAIMVFIQYLTQLEGPMWRQIRGLGLAYHYSMYVLPESGLLYFLLAKSTHIVRAYKEGQDIVMNYVNGKTELNDIELESAKSSLTFEVIEKETTVSDVSTQSLLSYFKGVPHTYNKDLLKLISMVTLNDLKRVGDKYIAKLFNEKEARRAVCCNPSKVTEVVTAFKEIGVVMEAVPSLDAEFLCAL
ncbi:uncharacterized protein C05D11.1-like [Ruditapes philippinarum]|uniref:uncharacterized protein C05D11.1-like n=1 Tax=Ruditapes philippinarum TaxID=129788 RepID=UPI00295B1822|nr:uncharacterized protein C05D11.1-like [Ruditapes philippinarum]